MSRPGGTNGPAGVRLASLLVGLSAVADLGMGQPAGEAGRTCFLDITLARAAGCDEATVADVFYTALLQHVGCTAFSHEASMLFGDEIAIKRASLATNFDRPQEILFDYLPEVVRTAPPGDRLRTLQAAVLRSRPLTDGYSLANCEVASNVARRLGTGEGVQRALLDAYEWWNGKGRPKRSKGNRISPVTRIVHVAGVAALFDRMGGPEAAIRALEQRAGGVLDPGLVAAFGSRCRGALTDLAGGADGSGPDVSDLLLDMEPTPNLLFAPGDLAARLSAFGDAVDLKAPFLHGHSSRVSGLAGAAAEALRLPGDDADRTRLAGLVHDLGRTAVPSRIWERAGPLGTDAWAHVRLHAYHSEQILQRCPSLAGIATLAGMHHERLDGSGYHRSAKAAAIPMAARILGAADAYAALTSARPHRPARSADSAGAELRAMVQSGALDADASEAVIAAADQAHVTGRRRRQQGGRGQTAGPAGLTERQIEVLRLVAQGLPNRGIARHLVISPRTAEHHVQDVYAKIGSSSRAAAALFAMEHGLLPEDG